MKIFKNHTDIKINKFSLVLIFISFLLGFAYRHNTPKFLINFKNKLEKTDKEFHVPKPKVLNNSFEEFCPRRISTLPKNSILIIGHAYGSHKGSNLRGNFEIAPKVYSYYLKNKQNIKSIIFSGDVLKEPSLKKWKNFYSKFKDETNIYIAPGNHDVGGRVFDSALRDVFNIISRDNQLENNFPYKLIINNSLFIIGDSNSRENSLDKIISIIEKEKSFKNIFVVMHHAFPEGLSDAANMKGKHDYIKDTFFEEKFRESNERKILFIYGDGGAFPNKPRYKCIKLANSFHMVSGIGELEGDTIFVIHNKNLYRMEI